MRKRFAERRNRAPVRFGRSREIREIVNEGGVDDGVGFGRAAVQTVEIIERTAMGLRAGGDKRPGRVIRASQAENLVACSDKFSDDGGADEAGRSRNEYTHKQLPYGASARKALEIY